MTTPDSSTTPQNNSTINYSEMPEYSTGPIIACQNAINHYMQHVQLAEADIAKLNRKISERKAELQTYMNMIDMWSDAKLSLQKAQQAKS